MFLFNFKQSTNLDLKSLSTKKIVYNISVSTENATHIGKLSHLIKGWDRMNILSGLEHATR